MIPGRGGRGDPPKPEAAFGGLVRDPRRGITLERAGRVLLLGLALSLGVLAGMSRCGLL